MQFSGGLIAEGTNLFMLSTRTSVADCITFFVAFHVLTAIDNIYAEGLSDFELREAIETPLVYKTKFSKIKFKDRTCSQQLTRIIWALLSLFYNSVYYYFLPFSVNFIPYIAPAPLSTIANDGH